MLIIGTFSNSLTYTCHTERYLHIIVHCRINLTKASGGYNIQEKKYGVCAIAGQLLGFEMGAERKCYVGTEKGKKRPDAGSLQV